MFQDSNPFAAVLGMNNARLKRGAERPSARRNFDGAPAKTLSVLDTGSRDAYNVDQPLHKNVLTIVIANTSSTIDATVVLFPGKYGERNFPDKTLIQGSNVTTQIDANDTTVTLTSDFGVGTGQVFQDFHTIQREDGLLVSNTRIEVASAAQRVQKLTLIRYDEFGDRKTDFLNPVVAYDPKQFNDDVLQFNTPFVLDKDTVLVYKLLKSQTVTMSFWVGSIFKPYRLLAQQAANSGLNSIL